MGPLWGVGPVLLSPGCQCSWSGLWGVHGLVHAIVCNLGAMLQLLAAMLWGLYSCGVIRGLLEVWLSVAALAVLLGFAGRGILSWGPSGVVGRSS